MIFKTKDIEKFLINNFNNIIVTFNKKQFDYENIYIEIERNLLKIDKNNLNPDIISEEIDLLKLITKYNLNLVNNKENVFLLSVLFVLFLTNFNHNALKLIYSFIDKFEYDKKELESFIESSDTRGLLFYLCRVYNEDYDKLNENIKYVYFEPKVDLEWMKKYYKVGRPISFWFYNNYMGKGLFVVLYTPKCRYKLKKGGCAGCSLPSLSSRKKAINKEDIIKQIDYVVNNISLKEKNDINEIIMSNNGSILDFKTIDYDALKYFIKRSIYELPYLKQIVFETRIDEYSDFSKMQDLVEYKNQINPEIRYEIAIGFEIFDDELRNNYYQKGIDKKVLEENIKKLKNLNVNLRVYMMFKPVPDKFMDINKAIEDINNAAKYFSDLNKKYNVNFILHITPTYLAKGTKLYKDYEKGLYTPVKLKDIELLYEKLKIYENIKYYISLNNEGLGDEFFDKDEYNGFLNLKRKIEKFNIKNKRQ